jgi:hypothetical protein
LIGFTGIPIFYIMLAKSFWKDYHPITTIVLKNLIPTSVGVFMLFGVTKTIMAKVGILKEPTSKKQK